MTAEETYRQRFLPLYPQLYDAAFALLADQDDASDAVQEVMMKLWSRRNMLSQVESPIGFSLTMIRNIAIDTIRCRKVSEQPNADSAHLIPDEPDSETFIKQAIATLPDAQREVLTLSAFGQLSGSEIAAATGQSADNVRQLLCRARRKLREIYNQHM